MIVVTGAAGFIGSVVLGKLNREGYINLVLVDDFSREDKKVNYLHKKYTALVDRKAFPEWLKSNQLHVDVVIHLGARTDTPEFTILNPFGTYVLNLGFL
jgi:ADP-L-glycero-D-manno-heptose 6-epimerase